MDTVLDQQIEAIACAIALAQMVYYGATFAKQARAILRYLCMRASVALQ